MVAVKFKKEGYAKYISHIDLLKHITRIIRRAELNIEYSNGFNPHMKLKMSLPTPLGVGSTAEYMTMFLVDTKAEEVVEKFNEKSINGIEIVKAWNVELNPNFAGKVVSCDYEMPIKKTFDCDEFVNQKEIIMKYEQKGVEKSKDIKPLINKMVIEDNVLKMNLSAGVNNLRVDRVANLLNEIYGTGINTIDINKVNQYRLDNKKLVNYEDYLNKNEISDN